MYIELKKQEDLFKVEVVYQNKKIDKLQEKLRDDGFYLVNKNVDEVSYFNMFYDEDINNIEMSLE